MRWAMTLLSVGCCLFATSCIDSSGRALGVGEVAPGFEGEGWINGPGPGDAETSGKVIVVDVWAHW